MLLQTAIRPSTSFFTRTRPILIAFGFSLPFLTPRPATRLDASPSALFSSSSYVNEAKTPVTRDGRTLNPAAVRQISYGSILGLGAGVLLSAFSTSLTFLIGVSIVVWQFAARQGYNIIPVNRLQRYVGGIDLKSAINDNVAFKISFGLMFALSAFGQF